MAVIARSVPRIGERYDEATQVKKFFPIQQKKAWNQLIPGLFY